MSSNWYLKSSDWPTQVEVTKRFYVGDTCSMFGVPFRVVIGEIRVAVISRRINSIWSFVCMYSSLESLIFADAIFSWFRGNLSSMKLQHRQFMALLFINKNKSTKSRPNEPVKTVIYENLPPSICKDSTVHYLFIFVAVTVGPVHRVVSGSRRWGRFPSCHGLVLPRPLRTSLV